MPAGVMIISVGKPWGKVSRSTKSGTPHDARCLHIGSGQQLIDSEAVRFVAGLMSASCHQPLIRATPVAVGRLAAWRTALRLVADQVAAGWLWLSGQAAQRDLADQPCGDYGQ